MPRWTPSCNKDLSLVMVFPVGSELSLLYTLESFNIFSISFLYSPLSRTTTEPPLSDGRIYICGLFRSWVMALRSLVVKFELFAEKVDESCSAFSSRSTWS
ncbi:hypothetical protein GDO81_016584 [Engystomops pustulosus]|uniref:Uncharacterized protein n=1 Tax=Engystomops pustulosus TaxID=76066 RepID=A0AAV7AUC6_ENGPU|nr:hypothetical protein GDO81_016584 [Engystomops pustulosus]